MLLTLLSRVGPIVLGAALRIQSELACPAPAEISANVQKLLDLSDESAQALHATAWRDGSWLVLGLADSDGTSLGERRLAYEGDCTTLARAAGVVFAGWLSNEHPEFLVGLPADSPEAQVAAAPNAAPALAPAPTPRAVEPPPASVVPQAGTAKPLTVPAGAKPRPARRFVLGAGLGAAESGLTFAPALSLSAAWDPGRDGWGARLSLAFVGAHTEPFAGHELSWTRWPLLAGPFLRLHAGRTHFELEAGAALAWLRLRGDGFDTVTSDAGVAVGGFAALRFVPNDAPLHAFIMLAPLLWFGDATAVATDATGASVTQKLPPLDVLLTLGAELPL